MRILLVEDQKALQEIFIQMLAEEPVECEIEEDGDEAFRRYCEEGPFDLVLTDQEHSGMTGAELVEQIKKKNPSQHALVLKKPFRKQHLLELVSAHTPGRKQ